MKYLSLFRKFNESNNLDFYDEVINRGDLNDIMKMIEVSVNLNDVFEYPFYISDYRPNHFDDITYCLQTYMRYDSSGITEKDCLEIMNNSFLVELEVGEEEFDTGGNSIEWVEPGMYGVIKNINNSLRTIGYKVCFYEFGPGDASYQLMISDLDYKMSFLTLGNSKFFESSKDYRHHRRGDRRSNRTYDHLVLKDWKGNDYKLSICNELCEFTKEDIEMIYEDFQVISESYDLHLESPYINPYDNAYREFSTNPDLDTFFFEVMANFCIEIISHGDENDIKDLIKDLLTFCDGLNSIGVFCKIEKEVVKGDYDYTLISLICFKKRRKK